MTAPVRSVGVVFLPGLAIALLAGSSPSRAQVAPPLGVAAQYGALGGSGVTGQAGGGAAVNGDVGSSPTPAVSNFPPSTVLPPFVLHLASDATTNQAQADASTAFANLLGQGPGTTLPAPLGGATVNPGIYSFATTADIAATQTLTLSGSGVYIFLVGSSITANVGSNVSLINGANACNVFWRVQISATLNGNNFPGTVIAGTSITVGDIVGPALGMSLTGRALALTGAVTMPGDGGTTIGGCSGQGGGGQPPLTPVPTLSEWALVGMGLLLAAAAVFVLRRAP